MKSLRGTLLLLAFFAWPAHLCAQEPTQVESGGRRKSGTYLKVGLGRWQGNIFSRSSLTQWDVDLFGADYDLTSASLDVETYFGDTLLQLSGFSIGYRKDNLRRAESGHMVSGTLFRDFDLKVLALKVGGGFEWGMPSLKFDQTEFGAADDGILRYRHTYVHRNAGVPFVGTATDGVVYPFVELSVVQRPWRFLFETGMRVGFVRFNLDDYEIGPADQLTVAFNRRTMLVPYVFADLGFRLF